MIDYNDNEKVMQMGAELYRLSQEYNKARQEAAKAKYKLDIILASRFEEIREKKKNVGYESALIMLLEPGEEEVQTYYKNYTRFTAQYKGLERLIDALHSRISLIQSLIKNQIKLGS